MKKFIKIIGVIIAFVAILISAVFIMTSGLTDITSAFFREVKSRNFDKASAYLSEDFKAETSQEELVKFLESNSFLEYKEATWNSRSISDGKGELEGTIVTESGGVLPVKITFVKENGEWKIYSIFKQHSGLALQNAKSAIPDKKELGSLVNESMIKFGEAIKAKHFEDFYLHIAKLWQDQASAAGLKEPFKAIMDANVDILPSLKVDDIVFDKEPLVDNNGFLRVSGHYENQVLAINFDLSYVQETSVWKLAGIEVGIKSN